MKGANTNTSIVTNAVPSATDWSTVSQLLQLTIPTESDQRQQQKDLKPKEPTSSDLAIRRGPEYERVAKEREYRDAEGMRREIES